MTQVKLTTNHGDIVLIAIGTGVVYEVLEGVLY